MNFPRHWLAWAALFVGSAAFFVLAYRANVFAVNHEMTDLAANSLLVLDAKSLGLWTGHYSRLGFNHPGPAILYVLAAGELLFYDWTGLVPSAFSGQLVAVAMYTSLWTCILGAQFLRMGSSRFIALLCVVFFLYSIAHVNPHFLVSAMMPHMFLLPFAVAVLSLGGLCEGRTDTLLPLAASSGFLVSGTFAFVGMLGVMLVVALAYNFATHRTDTERRVLPGWWSCFWCLCW
jgi:hypothetical protein